MSDDMKREMNALRTEMHNGMGELRDELRNGLGETRREMKEMRAELRHEMGDIRSMFRRTMIHVARMTGDMADMKRDMATKDDISGVIGSIAGLSGKVDDMRLDWAKNHDRLNDHDRRLDRLDHPQA